MKKWILAIALVSISFFASAKEVVMVKYASDEGWSVLEKALVSDGYMKAGESQFNTRGISEVVYNGLTEEQQKSISRDGFHPLNRMVNNLPEVMQVAEFRKRAAARELVKPEVQVAQAAQAPTESDQVPVPLAQASTTKSPVEAIPQAVGTTIQSLEDRVVQLEAQGKDATALRKEVEALQSARANAITTDDLKRVAAGVTEVRNKFADYERRLGVVETTVTSLTESVTKIGNATETIGREVVGVKQKVADQGKVVAKHESRLTAMEGKADTGMWTNVGIALAIVLAVWALARTFGNRQSKSATAKAVTPEAEKVSAVRSVSPRAEPTLVRPAAVKPVTVKSSAPQPAPASPAFVDTAPMEIPPSLRKRDGDGPTLVAATG
jgi:hypothetical protein